MTTKRIVETPRSRGSRKRTPSIEAPLNSNPEVEDLRSPLQRFRTNPKKALSVTDLISPSWCELQYWYTLTKHGKKRPTPAMRQGSKVHKILEDQIHKTVEVNITTKEDAWGLRIWNAIQGLRTLRDTGMTRELEVWGVIDGLVVNGVIDELSYICPDRELEEAATKPNKDTLPANQTSIKDFLGSGGRDDSSLGEVKALRDIVKKTSKIYLTDVKTRGIKSIPKGPSFRPTLMQLMLYHRLLSDTATSKVDPTAIFERYDLKPTAPFSDNFIAQIGNLNQSFFDAPADPDQTQATPPPEEDTVQILLEHNSLQQLWALMIQEFRLTMPDGAHSIGNVLKAEYRAQGDGAIMGIKTFLYAEDVLQTYLTDEMRWWNGEREARGVCIEEAYKCGYCEFTDQCSWRKDKIEQATEAHRARTRSVV